MITFPGKRENEQVLHVVHRHWFNLFAHFFIVFLLFAITFGGLLLFTLLFPDTVSGEKIRIVAFLENSFLLFLWLYIFLLWIDYYFDVWIITSERIINIEQKGLFVRHTSEVDFSRIQDISTSVTGFIATILNFGDLSLQTASENERVTFRQVADPNHLKDEIMRLARRDQLASK
jgi:membrane protein YdbS with pleckstrin-like domain